MDGRQAILSLLCNMHRHRPMKHHPLGRATRNDDGLTGSIIKDSWRVVDRFANAVSDAIQVNGVLIF